MAVMKKIITLFALMASASSFAGEFSKNETACGSGESNADIAAAYAQSYADAECNHQPARRASGWKITNFIESETGAACTKVEAEFSCSW